MTEHLVKYILYINNILVKVKLMETIELQGRSREQVGGSVGSVTIRCPANSLLDMSSRCAHT